MPAFEHTTYRTVMSFDYKTYTDDGKVNIETKFLPFDVVTGRSINDSSNIVTQPLLNGDNASDHSYRNPTTIGISGKFSMYGMYAEDDSYDFINGDNTATKTRLENIEATLKYLKDNGVLCTIYFLGTDDEELRMSNIRRLIDPSDNMFMVRERFAIESYNLNENIGGMDFSINFKEIIIVDDTSYEEYTSTSDPSTAVYKTTSYTSYLSELPDEQLGQIIMKALYENKYVEDSYVKLFLEESAGKIKNYLIVTTIIKGLFLLKGGKVILSVASSLKIAKSMAAIASAMGGTATATAASAGTASATAGAAGATSAEAFAAASGAGAAGAAGAVSAVVVPVAIIVAVIIVSAIIYGAIKRSNAIKKKKKSKAYLKIVNGKTDEANAKFMNLLIDVRNALREATTNLKVIMFPEGATTTKGLINLEGKYYEVSTAVNTSYNDYDEYFKWEVRRCSDGVGNFVINKIPPINDKFENMKRVNAWFRDEVNNKAFVWIYSSAFEQINENDSLKDKLRSDIIGYREYYRDFYGNGTNNIYPMGQVTDEVLFDPYNILPIDNDKTAQKVRELNALRGVTDTDREDVTAPFKNLANYWLIICTEEVSKEYDKCLDVITDALGL